ncbi:DUF3987 domain-containing protein [Sedimentisphaera salicampi]|uniref:DUF3987 domain-containing protein n=1 Tax=Sedimentisphaera salicampi TaxID=1941349 RepID=UPI000B9B2F0D|nr:DUF3987 domain-containing protein [Sedimentisphaera salicampi]OXU15401.1 hypothetical protein SMSP1_00882 [Sedimentisphaera salicampi]
MSNNILTTLDTDIALHSDWPELIPLEQTTELPEFPIEALRQVSGLDWLAELLEYFAGLYNFPIEMAFANLMGLAATGSQRHIKINIDGVLNSNLYLLMVYPSGAGKSISQNRIFKPAHDYEQQLQQDYRDRKAQAEEAQEEFTETMPQIVTQDITPQTLIPVVRNNHGKISIVSCEDSLFPNLAGLYNKGNAVTGAFKSLYSGEYLSVNRKSEDYQGGIFGLASACIATQPVAFSCIKNFDILSGDGTLSRFLYYFPEERPPQHRRDRRRNDKAQEDLFEDIANMLLSINGELYMNFTKAAETLWEDYHYDVQVESQDDDTLRPYRRRLPEFAVRLALNLHILKHLADIPAGDITELPPELSEDVVSAAIEIVRANEAHARKVYGLIETPAEVRIEQKIINWITRQRREQFTRNELYHSVKRSSEIACKTSNLDTPLLELQNQGYIKQVNQQADKAGRPRESYVVNPKLYA